MFDLKIYEEKMEKALDVLKREYSGLRTGRASISLLDPIFVDAYGSKTPLNQVSNVSVPESRLITVQVWDESLVNSVENAIRNSNLGLNPMIEGNLIRIPIPDLSEERRKEIVKIASKYSEDSKVVIRNIRREAMEKIKDLEKNKDISKDDSFKFSDDVQKITDNLIEKVELLFSDKEKDILRV
jgi:ribosome recycling factor|tara:strand:+ start:898 stop:1449 length:552 start_codon:yes stop_codon:yes gene_type:complete